MSIDSANISISRLVADQTPGSQKAGILASLKPILLRGILLLAIAFAAYEAYAYVSVGRFMVSTDDAYIKADMATIAAKVAGHIVDVPVTDNQRVKAGEVLVRIDDGDYQLAAAAARGRLETQNATVDRIAEQIVAQNAAVEQARAQVDASKAEYIRAQSEFERSTALAKLDYGSQQRLEVARADRDKSLAAQANAAASVTAAEGALAVLKAQKQEAERTKVELKTSIDRAVRDLSFTTVRAPFDGVVGNRAAQPGAYVQPGTRLLALVPLQSVYVEANLKETQLAAIVPGQTVAITVDALGDRKIEGAVESFAPATGSLFSLLPPENATGNFTKIVQRVPVRIRLPADIVAEERLRPGLSVIVDIDTRSELRRRRDVSSAQP